MEGAPRAGATAGPVIEIRDITKAFGDTVAVDGVSFEVRRGEVLGFLGPNAAGKTTTMRILTGYLAPTSGNARIAGLDVTRDRIDAAERLGYLPENGPLYLDMTARETLIFLGRARGMERERRRVTRFRASPRPVARRLPDG